MERLDFSNNTAYSNIEACIHLNRYATAKPYCKDAKVLDAACGQGYGSYLMKCWGAKEVDGIDISEEAVSQAKKIFKADGLNYIQHTVESLPYEDNTFDLVVSLETIEHVDDVDSFLKEIKRVLKPDGVVVLSCPNDNYYFQNDNFDNPYHKRAYTFFEFRELAERHLGSYADFYLAFALDGFINIPFEHRTEPDRSYIHDALSLFRYVKCDEALCVPQQSFLNHWNCNYYVGIWGNTNQGYRYNATISPRETFIDHKDTDYDLLGHLNETEKAGRELEEKLAEAEKRIGDVENEKRELEEKLSGAEEKILQLTEFNQELEDARAELLTKNIEGKRLTMLLDLVTKERDFSREYILKQDDYIHELEATRETNGRELVLKDDYIHELEATLADTKEKYGAVTARLTSLESSRGVKLLQKWYMLRHREKKAPKKSKHQ